MPTVEALSSTKGLTTTISFFGLTPKLAEIWKNYGDISVALIVFSIQLSPTAPSLHSIGRSGQFSALAVTGEMRKGRPFFKSRPEF